MNICALCDVVITHDNDTKEHIIPNSIGGRKKVKGFICNTCNSITGQDWDVELNNQLNYFNLLFMIKRGRGTPASERIKTISGKEYLVHHSGVMSPSKPSLEIKKKDKNHQIRITARNNQEAKKILGGLKRKYKSIDEKSILKNWETKNEYLKEPLSFKVNFGGPKAGRSLIKTALSLAYDAGIASSFCDKAVQYLRDKSAEPCFGYFYTKDLITNRPPRTPLHCVHVYSSPSTGLLLAYIEYFGIQRIIACLSEQYYGIEISKTYAINPVTGIELNLHIDLKAITINDIKKAYNYESYSAQKVIEAFDQVMPLAIDISFEREKNRVISEAVQKAFEKVGVLEGDNLSAEDLQQIVKSIVKDIWPFIHHHVIK